MSITFRGWGVICDNRVAGRKRGLFLFLAGLFRVRRGGDFEILPLSVQIDEVTL